MTNRLWVKRLVLAGAVAALAVLVSKRNRQSSTGTDTEISSVSKAPDPAVDREPETPVAHSLRRIERSFRDIYMQLISIIQGLAFTTLAGVVVINYSTLTAGGWIRVTAAFLFIVAAWEEYMVGSMLFAWVPTPLDALVPFVLGAIEFALITTVTSTFDAYLGVTTVMWAASLIAYSNYTYHARRGFASNVSSYQLLRRFLRSGLALTWFFAISYAALWILYGTLYPGLRNHQVAIGAATIAGPAVSILHFIRDWNGAILRARRHQPSNQVFQSGDG